MVYKMSEVRMNRNYVGLEFITIAAIYIITATVIAVAFGLLFIFLSLWVLILFHELQGGADVWQLILDLILLPTVIIGFVMAIKEFRKSQALPNLELLWSGGMTVTREGKPFILEASEHREKNFPLLLHVKNDGTSIATKYRIRFDVPRELVAQKTLQVHWERGGDDCREISTTLDTKRYEFKSNDQYALYPGEVVHFATLKIKLLPQSQYPEQVLIRHSVVTDKTKIQHGVLKLKIRKPTKRG